MTDNMIRWELGADRILVLTMDDPTRPVNTMTDQCRTDLRATADRLVAEKDTFDGVILTSGKDTFFAGADLNYLMTAGPQDVAEVSAFLDEYKAAFRTIETLGKPVVAAINGTALGGGFEFALACHHRIALDKKGSLIGLPEVTLGVLPGAGGVTRVVRLIGIANALRDVIGQGQKMSPAKALDVGIIDQVVAGEDELFAAARAWIKANPEASRPWDRKGYQIPGGTPASPSLVPMLPAFPATVRKQLKGAPMPAPIAVVAAAVEGAQVDVDTAFAIETRYCANLICGTVSGNIIKTQFFDLNSITKGASRPEGYPKRKAEKVAVLGAGMMGAAIAYVTAVSGASVVMRDLTVEAAERGKDYSRKLLDKSVARGKLTAQQRDDVLDRIVATDDLADVTGADLVIEAVFEDIELKKKVFAEVQQYVTEDALIATNTSALPVSEMAESTSRPKDFIGLHFFSPVDKMPLLEIVVGEQTSDETLAHALDFARQITKTPIVVKDVYGFYANRVIMQFVDQALSMVGEGAHPASVEQAATQAGFPVGVLALLDEINMRTIQRVNRGFAELATQTPEFAHTPGSDIVDRMVEEFDRPGRLDGKGFYDYAEDGTRQGLWPTLIERYHRPEVDMPFEDMTERPLIAAALEAARCYEKGIVRSIADANIGSIFGIGFPAWTGGTLQYIDQYESGPAGFAARADELRARYGDRFVVPDIVRDRAAAGEPLNRS